MPQVTWRHWQHDCCHDRCRQMTIGGKTVEASGAGFSRTAPLTLGEEGLALLNGTQFSTA